MILATKRKDVQQSDPKIMQQIQALKQMYGIQKQKLKFTVTRSNADRKFRL